MEEPGATPPIQIAGLSQLPSAIEVNVAARTDDVEKTNDPLRIERTRYARKRHNLGGVGVVSISFENNRKSQKWLSPGAKVITY
jgi:hypothetical protein